MSRWFRHYAGMMRDEKLVRAAMKSKQSVERVVWVWGAILESAGEINDAGRYDFDAGEAAYFLRCDESDILDILAALVAMGRVSDGVVVKWSDRQFDSDQSRERQKRYRERLKASGDRNGDVPPPSRDAEVTPQETETEAYTETDTEITARPVAEPARQRGARDIFDDLLEAYPDNPSSSDEKAWAVFKAMKQADQEATVIAAQRFAKWSAQDAESRGRTIEAQCRYSPHLSNWLSDGTWKNAAKLAIKGEGSPDMMVIHKGSPEFIAVEKLRGKPIPVFSESGAITITRAELQRATAAVH